MSLPSYPLTSKFRRDGTPYPPDEKGLFEWAKDAENPKLQIVAKTKHKGYEVSTVWMGLDHSWGNGPPLIFETMIFKLGSYKAACDDYQERYSTEQEALTGHEVAVKYLKNHLRKPTK